MPEYRLNLLLSQKEITSIVEYLAERISDDYGGTELVLVCILKGAFIFLSDLIRHLRIPIQIDFVRLASYGSGTETSGRVEVTKDIELSIAGKDVLIIEDIIDSGHTVQFLKERLALSEPHSIRVCTLLDKKARREAKMDPEYVGKEIRDVFVVGYGIDFNEAYRHLPDIYFITFEDQKKG